MISTLESLESTYKNCKNCELYKTRQTIVFGSGNPKAGYY